MTCVTAPIYDGYVLEHGVNKLNFGGRDLQYYLGILLKESRSYNFSTSGERDILNNIKEKLCYVSLDFKNELKKSQNSNHSEISYKLPDGNVKSF